MLQTWGQLHHSLASHYKLQTTVAILWYIRLEGALDLEYEITNRYTGKYFEEEIKGLADASGCSEKKIRRIHMIGELTSAITGIT